MKTIFIIGGLGVVLVLGFLGFRWIRVFWASDYHHMLKALYKNTVPLLRPQQVETLEEYTILDTRAANEYAVSSLPNALWVNYPTLNQEVLATIPKNKKILLYCSVGYRSERIGEQLLTMGFSQVYNLYGGIFEWVNTGHVVVNPSDQNPTSKVHGYAPSWGKWLGDGVEVVYE